MDFKYVSERNNRWYVMPNFKVLATSKVLSVGYNCFKNRQQCWLNAIELTGSNKLCHWNGRIMGTIDNTIADRTPCIGWILCQKPRVKWGEFDPSHPEWETAADKQLSTKHSESKLLILWLTIISNNKSTY